MQNNLKKIIDENGLKIGWVAEKAGVNRNTITSLINGSTPKIDIAMKIANVLNVSVYDIWSLE